MVSRRWGARAQRRSGGRRAAVAREVIASAAGTSSAAGAITPIQQMTGDAPGSSTPEATLSMAPPVNTVLPAITGSLYAGATLTCSTGTWAGATSFAYQWKRDGTPIGGETAATHVAVLADEGTSVTCAVAATGPGGTTSADSAGVTIWSPAAGTGAHWWRGDDVAWVAGSPDKLTTFNAKLGAITLTQATAGLKPEYLATLAALGQPGGKFVKANSHEMAATGLSVAAPWTIVLGFAHTSLADNEIIIGGTAGSDWYFRYRTTSGGLWGFVGGGAGEALTSGVTPATATPYYAVIVLNGTSSKIRINGVSRYAGATDLGANALTAVRMSRSTSFDLPFDGEAGEVVVIPGDLTADAAELARYEGYLSARYT